LSSNYDKITKIDMVARLVEIQERLSKIHGECDRIWEIITPMKEQLKRDIEEKGY